MKGAEKKNAWYKTSWRSLIYVTNFLYACMAKLQLTLLSQHRAESCTKNQQATCLYWKWHIGMHLQLFELESQPNYFTRNSLWGRNVCMRILLQHSGIDRTLPYCWRPVSSFKECVQPAIRDISSFYDGLISKTKQQVWVRPSFIHLISCCLSFLCYKKLVSTIVYWWAYMGAKVWNAGCRSSAVHYQDINARRQSTSESCTIKRLRIISLLIREKWKY